MGTTAEKLAYLAETKQQIKTAIENKGVSIPDGTTFRQYAEKVGEISGGGSSKYGMTIDNIFGDVDENGTYVMPQPFGAVFSGIKTVNTKYAISLAYNKNIVSVSFPDLEVVNSGSALEYAFFECENIETISFPKLRSVSGENSFYYTFGYAKIKEVTFPALEEINTNYAFDRAFRYSGLEKISFPALTNVSSNPFGTSSFANVTNLKEIHFRADMQSVIEGLTGYSTKWGATNATIYFDL